MSSVVKKVKQLEPSYTSRRNVKLHNHFRQQLNDIAESENTPTLWSSNSTAGYLLKRNENISPYKEDLLVIARDQE